MDPSPSPAHLTKGRHLLLLLLASLPFCQAVGQAVPVTETQHSEDTTPPAPTPGPWLPSVLFDKAKPEIKNDLHPLSKDPNLTTWLRSPKYRFPWIASIRDALGGHRCLGTLIHPEYVLTAAHCLQWAGMQPKVEFGLSGEGYEGQVAKTKSSEVHPKWKGTLYRYNPEYDVALLQLERPVTHLGRPTLAAPGITSTRKEVYPNVNVLGFRLGASLETAMFMALPIQCCPNLTIATSVCFCIYSEDAKMEAGVSGGPVLVPDWADSGSSLFSADGRFSTLDLLVGVVSCNNGSATWSGVGVADVAMCRPWIERKINPKADLTSWELAFILILAWVLSIVCFDRIPRARVHQHHH